MGGMIFNPFRKKKEDKLPIINQAVQDRDRNLNDIYNWQNENVPSPTPAPKKKKK